MTRAHDALQPVLFGELRLALVVEHERAAFDRRDVLVRVEAERHEVAGAADRLAAPVAAEALRRVLDDAQPVTTRDVVQPRAVDRQPGEVDGNDRLRLRVDCCFHPIQVDVARHRVDVREHRPRAHVEHDVGRRHPGQRRRDDLVVGAFADACDAQRDLHRARAGVERAHRAAAAVRGQLGLELPDVRTRRDPAGTQHVDDAGDGGLVDGRAGEREVCGRRRLGNCAHRWTFEGRIRRCASGCRRRR